MIRPHYKFVTIVADPPWNYGSQDFRKKKSADGSYPHRGIGPKDSYKRMTIKEIGDLAIPSIVQPNAHLYLWTTNKFLGDAFNIARQWGFRPITVITWVKVHLNDPTKASCKTGTYFRGATEHIVFGVRGSLKLASTDGIPTAFMSPRLPHSVKPEWFYELMEKVNQPGPRLDLFARKNRTGWYSWGDQVPNPVILPELTRTTK